MSELLVESGGEVRARGGAPSMAPGRAEKWVSLYCPAVCRLIVFEVAQEIGGLASALGEVLLRLNEQE
jgi:hypothetical protein